MRKQIAGRIHKTELLAARAEGKRDRKWSAWSAFCPWSQQLRKQLDASGCNLNQFRNRYDAGFKLVGTNRSADIKSKQRLTRLSDIQLLTWSRSSTSTMPMRACADAGDASIDVNKKLLRRFLLPRFSCSLLAIGANRPLSNSSRPKVIPIGGFFPRIGPWFSRNACLHIKKLTRRQHQHSQQESPIIWLISIDLDSDGGKSVALLLLLLLLDDSFETLGDSLRFFKASEFLANAFRWFIVPLRRVPSRPMQQGTQSVQRRSRRGCRDSQRFFQDFQDDLAHAFRWSHSIGYPFSENKQ